MSTSLVHKKIAGSIYGGAIGDAMGGPLEGATEEFITKYHNGRVKTLEPYHKPAGGAANISVEAGTYTDDTRLKNILCQAIIEKKGRVTAEDLAVVWRRDMKPEQFFITEQLAYHLSKFLLDGLSRFPYAKDINPAITARDCGRNAFPACDANMMISPIGLINAFNPYQAALDAYEVTLFFQSGYSASSCSPIAAAVAEAMKPDATWETVVETAKKYADRFTAIYLNKALQTADESKHMSEFKPLFYERHLVHFVDPMEVVPAAFGIFVVCRGKYTDCVIEAANFGRDCDTIAGIVGSIAGALRGIDAVPAEWIRTVKAANPAPDLDKQIDGLYESLLNEVTQTRARIEAIEKNL